MDISHLQIALILVNASMEMNCLLGEATAATPAIEDLATRQRDSLFHQAKLVLAAKYGNERADWMEERILDKWLSPMSVEDLAGFATEKMS